MDGRDVNGIPIDEEQELKDTIEELETKIWLLKELALTCIKDMEAAEVYRPFRVAEHKKVLKSILSE